MAADDKAGVTPAGSQTSGATPGEGGGGATPPPGQGSPAAPPRDAAEGLLGRDATVDRVAELERMVLAMKSQLADADKLKRDSDSLREINARMAGKAKTAEERIAHLEERNQKAEWRAQLAQQFGQDEGRIQLAMLALTHQAEAFLEPDPAGGPARVKMDALLAKYDALRPALPGPSPIAGTNPMTKPPTLQGSAAELERAIQGGNEYSIWNAFQAWTKKIEEDERAIKSRMPRPHDTIRP